MWSDEPDRPKFRVTVQLTDFNFDEENRVFSAKLEKKKVRQ
jgi:hypothetical protein